MLRTPIEEFTDKELENAIKLHEDLLRFYKQVKYAEELQLALITLQEFLEKLHKERERRKSYNRETIV